MDKKPCARAGGLPVVALVHARKIAVSRYILDLIKYILDLIRRAEISFEQSLRVSHFLSLGPGIFLLLCSDIKIL